MTTNQSPNPSYHENLAQMMEIGETANTRLQSWNQLFVDDDIQEHLQKFLRYWMFDKDSIDDVIQETYIQISHNVKRGTFKYQAHKVSAYIKQTAQYIVQDMRRKDEREPCESQLGITIGELEHAQTAQHGESNILFQLEEMLNVSSDLEKYEVIKILSNAMNKLSEDERRLIYAYYYEETPIKDIAQTQGISPNTATKRKKYAMDRLLGHLKNQL